MSVTVISLDAMTRTRAEALATELYEKKCVLSPLAIQLHCSYSDAIRSSDWVVKAELINEAFFEATKDDMHATFMLCGTKFYAGNIDSSYFNWLVHKDEVSSRTKRTLDYYGADIDNEYIKEATFLSKAKEFCSLLGPSCLVVREAAATRNGVADLILCYKGRFVACELKRYNGVPSPQQLKFIESVKAAGGSGGVCRCLRDIWNLMEHTAP